MRSDPTTASDQDAPLSTLIPELTWIADVELRDAVASILRHCFEAGNFAEPTGAPFSEEIPAADCDNIAHSRAVARIALASAQVIGEMWHIEVPADHVVAAALVHDAGKWFEFRPDPAAPAGTALAEEGRWLPHPMYGVALAMQHGLPPDIIDAVAAHSPANDQPTRTPLAVILHHADMAVADACRLRHGLPSRMKVRHKLAIAP